MAQWAQSWLLTSTYCRYALSMEQGPVGTETTTQDLALQSVGPSVGLPPQAHLAQGEHLQGALTPEPPRMAEEPGTRLPPPAHAGDLCYASGARAALEAFSEPGRVPPAVCGRSVKGVMTIGSWSCRGAHGQLVRRRCYGNQAGVPTASLMDAFRSRQGHRRPWTHSLIIVTTPRPVREPALVPESPTCPSTAAEGVGITRPSPGPEALCSMLAPTNNVFHRPLWLSNRLSPREEQELELDYLDSRFPGDIGKHWTCNPSWEAHLVSKARAMLVTEQSLVLDTISVYLYAQCQLVEKHRTSDSGMDIQRLLEFLKMDPQKAEDKVFLFQLYGIFLRECADMELVKWHLTCLLESSHLSCSQREGIALSVGLASTTHLEEVWALLEHMGRTRFLRWALPSPESQDEILESSFLSASILLTRVLRKEYGAQNYKFTQTPELIQCLLCILQKEPDFLATLCRQKVILVIVGLSNLRPSLKPLVKSRILQTCLRSVYLLPPIEELKSKSPPLEPAPDVMVTLCFWATPLLPSGYSPTEAEPASGPELGTGSGTLGLVPTTSAVAPESADTPFHSFSAFCQKSCSFGADTWSLSSLLRSLGSGSGPAQMGSGVRALAALQVLAERQWVLGSSWVFTVMADSLTEPFHSPRQLPGPSGHQGDGQQALYGKTVRALDLLLQNFFLENPSMDELSFLLQHTERWLKSDRSHERKRVVLSIFLLLQYVVDSLKFTPVALGAGDTPVPQLLRRPKQEGCTGTGVWWPTCNSHLCVCALRGRQQQARSESPSHIMNSPLSRWGHWVREARGLLGWRRLLWVQGRRPREQCRNRPQRAHVAHRSPPQEEATPSVLGHHIGLLTLLCRDKDKVTRSRSQQCVSLLLHLVVEQKGRALEFMPWNKAKHFEVKVSKEWEMKLGHMVKAFRKDLTVAQHTQLVLTLLHGLHSHSHLRCDLASRLLLMIFQDAGVKPEQVAEILHSLLQELPGIRFKNVYKTMMKAIAALGNQHTQEVVEVTLSLSHPFERKILFLWRTLATNQQLARKVMTILYMKLKLRPSREFIQPTRQAQLVCLKALNTIYELLYTQEYRGTVRWAFAGVLMGLLTQLHYLLELGMVEGMSDYQEDILDDKPLGPCRTCLEALKGLFWTTNYWEVFAHVKLLNGWECLECLETYPQGVTLLARAMSHYDCEVKAILGQAIIFLKNSEERDNLVAILIISEFLNSPDVFQHVNQRSMVNFMNLNLKNPNPLVRAMSLQALSSTLMHPNKMALLQSRLLELLDSFLQPEPNDPLGLMQILGDILHRLGDQGAVILKIAQHLRLFFEDVSRLERKEERGKGRDGACAEAHAAVRGAGGLCGPADCAVQPRGLPARPGRGLREDRVPFAPGDPGAALPSGFPPPRADEKNHSFERRARAAPGVSAEVRGCAIFLFGDVIHSGGKKFRQALKTFAFQALVPLLFHLADSCPEVVMKTKLTFLRCAILLKWEFRKELFSKLAWGRGLGAENDVFIYMIESNFGNYHQFFMQALTYLHSPHRNLKLAAMRFIGGMLQDYFADLCFYLKKGDIKTLKKSLKTLREDPDSMCRRFYLNFMGDVMELSHYVT
ncbi:maestro heat-like repeat family member 5 [Urocitellus parryii]